MVFLEAFWIYYIMSVPIEKITFPSYGTYLKAADSTILFEYVYKWENDSTLRFTNYNYEDGDTLTSFWGLNSNNQILYITNNTENNIISNRTECYYTDTRLNECIKRANGIIEFKETYEYSNDTLVSISYYWDGVNPTEFYHFIYDDAGNIRFMISDLSTDEDDSYSEFIKVNDFLLEEYRYRVLDSTLIDYIHYTFDTNGRLIKSEEYGSNGRLIDYVIWSYAPPTIPRFKNKKYLKNMKSTKYFNVLGKPLNDKFLKQVIFPY